VTVYFADESFWIALSSRRDQYHSQALAWHAAVARTGSRIVTTEAVLWEWLNALSDTSSRRVVAEGYQRVHRDSSIEVVSFEPELIGSAFDLYRGRSDKDWSLTDCLSFVVMQRRQLTNALTTDRHFEQAGLAAAMLDQPRV
jgi:uncharacterized protein